MRAPDRVTGSKPLLPKVSCLFPAEYNLKPESTRRARAVKSVERGDATWIDQNTIQLTDQAMRRQYVDHWLFLRNQAVLTKRTHDSGYDAIDRVMTMDEIPNIPICGDLSKLLTKRS